MTDAGISVLYDDRDMRPGEKFADADLLGIPYGVVISQKTVDSNKVELKPRASDEVEYISSEELLNRFN